MKGLCFLKKSKEVKFYNVIFPIWFLLFFPPVIFITLVGNFIIDSLVVLLCFYVFKQIGTEIGLKDFYKRSIIKVWLLGFLADIIGAAILFATGILGDMWGVPYELTSAINYDPFSSVFAVLIILFAMFVAGLLIFLFNYLITFKNVLFDAKLRFKVALTIAIITIPWTFLLPTKWFYY